MSSELDVLCRERDLVIWSTETDETPPDGFPNEIRSWFVTVVYQGRKFDTSFFTGSAFKTGPTAADVISCLITDTFAGNETFADFCAEFGYDEDSRRAYATWEKCHETSSKVEALLGDDFELFANAEH